MTVGSLLIQPYGGHRRGYLYGDALRSTCCIQTRKTVESTSCEAMPVSSARASGFRLAILPQNLEDAAALWAR